MYPHEKQLADNNLAVTDLPEKTQKRIAKFTEEKDDVKRESLDESIFGDIEDYLDDKKAKEKADAKKAAHTAAKKKVDVSGAPTAQDAATKAAAEKAAAEKAAAKKKERTPLATIFGRSSE
jgi:membrane protein involved in colicin uptake